MIREHGVQVAPLGNYPQEGDDISDTARQNGNMKLGLDQLAGRFTAIAATPHAELWDVSGPILLLGSWCELALNRLSGVEYAVLPNLWQDRSRIAQAEAYCWNFWKRLLPQLAERLNEIHGVRHPLCYWELMLEPWWVANVHAVYDRYLLACEARRIAPGAPLAVPGGTSLPPATTLEARNRVSSDAGNLMIFSLVFRALGLPVVERGSVGATGVVLPSKLSVTRWQNCALFWQRCLRYMSFQLRYVSSPLKRLVCMWLARRAGMRVLMSVSRMSLIDNLLMAFRVPGLRVLPSVAPSVPMTVRVDQRRRETLRHIRTHCEFEQVFVSLLPYLIPATLVENYEHLVAVSRATCGDREVAVVFTYYNDALLEFLARSRSAGFSVSMYQHGGGYGHYRVYPFERYQITEGRTFLSWGDHGPFSRPLPSPHLSRLLDSHRGGTHIVLVELSMPKYLYRLHSKPMCQPVERLAGPMVTFIDNLSELVKAKVVLKPIPGFENYETIRHPKLEVLPREWTTGAVLAYEWMRDARLAVVTYPETTFIEALTLNVPTIGLWDHTLFEMRAEAQPYFDALAAAGIIYNNPVAAAQRVSAVYAHADRWWQGEDIQRARLGFLARFGLASRDWRKQWARYLRELATQSAERNC